MLDISGESKSQRKIHKLQIMCKCGQKKLSPGPLQEAARHIWRRRGSAAEGFWYQMLEINKYLTLSKIYLNEN